MTIKIGLERLDTQEGITVEALLDSGATGLVMSSEFTKKKGFKLKKLERPMQVRNVDGSFNITLGLNVLAYRIYRCRVSVLNSGLIASS